MSYRVHSAPACAQLRPYVRAYAQREIDSGFDTVSEAIPARLDQLLLFEFGTRPELQDFQGKRDLIPRVTVSGLETQRRLDIYLHPPVDSFGVFFQPQGLRQIFGVPNREMLSIWYEAHQLLGHDIRELAAKMGETSRFADRVFLVEKYLIKRASQARHLGSIGKSAMYLFQRPGAMRVSDLAGMSALSMRQYERLFQKEIGIPPKLFARISRFQNALNAKMRKSGRSWLEIAHDFGYHDQMHMIRDFRSLGGDTPAGVVTDMGDKWADVLAGWREGEDMVEESW